MNAFTSRSRLPVCDARRRTGYAVQVFEEQALRDGSHPFFEELHHAQLMAAVRAERDRLRAECRQHGIDPASVWPQELR